MYTVREASSGMGWGRVFTAGLVFVGLCLFVFTLLAPLTARAQSCSSGSFGFLSTCSSSYSIGGGCTVTTICKKKWWGFGGNKCSSSTSCPAPESIVQEATSFGSPRSPNSGSCPPGQNSCGLNCIPGGSVCCSTAGYPDRYCPGGTTCTTKGQCETGGKFCVANSGKVCSSTANSCGKSSVSSYLCDGSCPVVSPADSSCPVPNIKLSVSPRFVNKFSLCTINGELSDITACTLTGPGVSVSISPTNANGSTQTLPVISSQTYTLKCSNGSVVKKEQSITCQLNPIYQEI